MPPGGGERRFPGPAPAAMRRGGRTKGAGVDERGENRRMRLRLDLAYDGSDFAGWQLQPGMDTVQGRIEGALARLYGRPRRRGAKRGFVGSASRIPVVAAGRTDAGVHAEHQVAHFDAPHPRVPPEGVRAALNHRLPGAIRILAAAAATADFHAQHHAAAKTYRYHLLTGNDPSPLRARFALPVGPALDREAMERAAEALPGAHDFRAFAAAPPDDRPETTVRTIREARFLDASPDEWIFEVTADGFLRYMVRRIVGSLLAAGRGQIPPETVAAMLRGDAAPGPRLRAPAAGLRLHRVHYRRGGAATAEASVGRKTRSERDAATPEGRDARNGAATEDGMREPAP